MYFDEDLYGADELEVDDFSGAAFEEDENEEEPDLSEVYDFGGPATAGPTGPLTGSGHGGLGDGRAGHGGEAGGSPAASTSRMAPSTSGGSQRRRRGSRGSGVGGPGAKAKWRSGHIPDRRPLMETSSTSPSA